jgi:hypothetical protein
MVKQLCTNDSLSAQAENESALVCAANFGAQLERAGAALRYAVRESLPSQTQRVQVGELRAKYEQLNAREHEVLALVLIASTTNTLPCA